MFVVETQQILLANAKQHGNNHELLEHLVGMEQHGKNIGLVPNLCRDDPFWFHVLTFATAPFNSLINKIWVHELPGYQSPAAYANPGTLDVLESVDTVETKLLSQGFLPYLVKDPEQVDANTMLRNLQELRVLMQVQVRATVDISVDPHTIPMLRAFVKQRTSRLLAWNVHHATQTVAMVVGTRKRIRSLKGLRYLLLGGFGKRINLRKCFTNVLYLL